MKRWATRNARHRSGASEGHRRRVDRDGARPAVPAGLDPDLERPARRRPRRQEHVRRDVSVGRDGGRGQGERRLLGSDHHRDRATLRLFLGDDLASERRERRHLEQSEPDPSIDRDRPRTGRGTGHDWRRRTSRHRAPASPRVGGGSRSGRSRPRQGRGLAWRRDVDPSMACPPFVPATRLPGRASGRARRFGNAMPGPAGRRLPRRRSGLGLEVPVAHIAGGPRPVDGHPRPRPGRPEGGLSTTSSTNLSTRTDVRRTACGTGRNRPTSVGAAVQPEPGRIGEVPALVVVELEAGERVVGEQQAAVQVDPVRQRRHDRRGGDRRPTSPPCSRGTSGSPAAGLRASIDRGRPDPADLGELDVDAGDDALERVEVLDRRPRDSSATIGRDERSWSQPRSRSERAGNGCSMSSTPRSTSVGRSSSAISRVQPVFASTRIGPPKTERTASSVARSSGPPHLILSAGKSAARPARSATTAGSSMPRVKSVGGIDGRQAEQRVDGLAHHLADEVVQRDVDRALRAAVPADRRQP